MRGFYQRDFSIEIKALRKHKHGASAPMAFLHHELSAENTVIPFSLSLPVSHIKASFAPFRWSSPRDEYRSPRSPSISRQYLSRL